MIRLDKMTFYRYTFPHHNHSNDARGFSTRSDRTTAHYKYSLVNHQKSLFSIFFSKPTPHGSNFAGDGQVRILSDRIACDHTGGFVYKLANLVRLARVLKGG